MADGGGECVRVVVRSRPFSKQELKDGRKKVLHVDLEASSVTLKNPDSEALTAGEKGFTFDAVYDDASTQRVVYDETAYPLVESVLAGYNGTIFAYGQTGCGKTHTMMGVPEPAELRGIIPNSFDHIFDHIQVASTRAEKTEFLVRCSYLEIYNEEIRDLLAPPERGQDAARLELHENPDAGVYVKDLSMVTVDSVATIDRVMVEGNKHRTTGSTLMNETSSRSHSIFTIVIEMSTVREDGKEHIVRGKLNLVDLAGSERASKTGATGARMKEGIKINLSLTALGNVISSLVENAAGGKQRHIPYRDSKLTRLLQDSLGGNTKTVMVAAVGPADYNYEETLSTLRYANRAKNIKNKPKVNEDPKDALLRQYKEEIDRLKSTLATHLAAAGLAPDVVQGILAAVGAAGAGGAGNGKGGRASQAESLKAMATQVGVSIAPAPADAAAPAAAAATAPALKQNVDAAVVEAAAASLSARTAAAAGAEGGGGAPSSARSVSGNAYAAAIAASVVMPLGGAVTAAGASAGAGALPPEAQEAISEARREAEEERRKREEMMKRLQLLTAGVSTGKFGAPVSARGGGGGSRPSSAEKRGGGGERAGAGEPDVAAAAERDALRRARGEEIKRRTEARLAAQRSGTGGGGDDEDLLFEGESGGEGGGGAPFASPDAKGAAGVGGGYSPGDEALAGGGAGAPATPGGAALFGEARKRLIRACKAKYGAQAAALRQELEEAKEEHATVRERMADELRDQTKITKLLEALVAVFMHPKERAKALDRALWDEESESWTLPRIKPRTGFLARLRPGDTGGGLLSGAPRAAAPRVGGAPARRGSSNSSGGGKGGGFASYGGGGSEEGEGYGDDWGDEEGGAVVIGEGEEIAAEALAIRATAVAALPSLPLPRAPPGGGGLLSGGGAVLPQLPHEPLGLPAIGGGELRGAPQAPAGAGAPLAFPSLDRGGGGRLGAPAGGGAPLGGLGLSSLPGISGGVGGAGGRGHFPAPAVPSSFSLPGVGGGGGGGLGALPRGGGGGLGGGSLPGFGAPPAGGSSWTAGLGLGGTAQSAVDSFFAASQPVAGGGLGSASLPSIGGPAQPKRR